MHENTTAAVAFSDVDETLIRLKSMFSFLEFHLARRGEPAGTFERLTAEIRRGADSGVPRHEINRRYYRFFTDESAAGLAASGRAWYARETARGLYVPEVRRALAAHRAAGDTLVLVSGSFFACLDPIAEETGADRAFGTRPVIRRGHLTGEVLVPMIGAAKGRAARVTLALRGADPDASTAYGDHISDLDLLRAVGRPVVVGSDPHLGAHAERAGWRRLPLDPTASRPEELETV
ncbi:HAD family hydrolase [Streptomyces avicenniae]|uniref:HAD family hydrolase n=1 Tax=Streptomyces avicenniae TaxID=500153 RepID=UPI000699EFB4|nr:HAD-IB family hydrolase [Streptomyces avicenniae]